MKKVLGFIAIVGFVACNSSESAAPAVDTTTQAYKDSVAAATATPVVDTTKKDTTVTATVDTTVKAATPAAH
jgi:hypothetical protein